MSESPESSLARLDGERFDVVIVGGGLAGLTCGLHLRRAHPRVRVAVVNKRRGRAREAAFKVGESVSEVGSHYFVNVLGLGDHIGEDQADKFGLRLFFSAGDNARIERRVEVGPPGDEAARRAGRAGVLPVTPVPTFQLDRGRFENELWDRCAAAGAVMMNGSRVTDVRLDEGWHAVEVTSGDERTVLQARWVVDASGRARMLQRQLGLEASNDHCINAAWLRLRGGLDVEDWSDDPTWRSRLPSGLRRYSTNHLVGTGYWVWIIQLGSGPASVGVVADPRHHPLEHFAEIETALEWMRRHEPQLAASIEARRDQVMDYLSVADFSYGCQRVFSPRRWCLVGEAGLFLDPLYSPGSDFIALGNTMAVSVIGKDLAADHGERHGAAGSSHDARATPDDRVGGERPAAPGAPDLDGGGDRGEGEERAVSGAPQDGGGLEDGAVEYLNGFYLRLYEGLLPVYQDQYHLLGNPEVGGAKVLWNNLTYWGVLCLLFFNGRVADVPFLRSIEDELDRYFRLLRRVEALFRAWAELGGGEGRDAYVCGRGRAVRFYVDLQRPHPDPDRLRDRIRRNLEHLEAIAVAMFAHAASRLPGRPLDENATVNPLAIGLEADRWDRDGLFDPAGVPLEVARRKAATLLDYLRAITANGR